MLEFGQVNGDINVAVSDGSGVCIEGPEQHGRPPACWISFQSLPIEIWGGEAHGLFAQQSGKKKALSHWVIASQGAAFLPQLFRSVGSDSWVFCTLPPHAVRSYEHRVLGGLKRWICPSSLPVPAGQRAAKDGSACSHTLFRDHPEHGSHLQHVFVRTGSQCARHYSTHSRGYILTWTPVGTGLYEFLHQKDWVQAQRHIFQI